MDLLKDYYSPDFYRRLAAAIKSSYPSFNDGEFYRRAIENLDSLELKERMRLTTKLCRRHLPEDFRRSVDILKDAAAEMNIGQIGLVGLFLPDFVGQYGREDIEFSLDALKYFTPISSSEFAIREFLLLDFDKTISCMYQWSRDEDHHVRRLSCEGSRPRLPWGKRLPMLIKDPEPARPILENLKADESLFVRKSVANHLNDISKDNREWMLKLVSGWDGEHPHTAWIVKRAARSLIKQGHPRAFSLLGFEADPRFEVNNFLLGSERLSLGEIQEFSFELQSRKKTEQKLAIDYIVHFVKKLGQSSPKVFKLRELTLGPGEKVLIRKRHRFQDYSTRTHYGGSHTIEIIVNGMSVASSSFELIV